MSKLLANGGTDVGGWGVEMLKSWEDGIYRSYLGGGHRCENYYWRALMGGTGMKILGHRCGIC